MIANENQYQVTLKQIKKFQDNITELEQNPDPDELRHKLYLSIYS
jgi:hypothetical protein